MKTWLLLKKIMTSLSLNNLKRRAAGESIEKSPKKSNRFNGLSENEVQKNFLKDYLEPDLNLVFIGINPSLMAAHTGRYYAGPGNHFYKLLTESKLVPEPVSWEDDEKLLQYKIGLTNIVARATRSSADLKRTELKEGAMLVKKKLELFKPKIAVFNGKCIYEEFDDKYDKKSFHFGLQPVRCGDTALWVVPSSSARCANFPRMQDKLHFYTAMKKYLAYLNGEIKEVNVKDFIFEGKCKQAIPSTSKMWRRQGLSAFAKGGKIVNKNTVCMDTSDENVCEVPSSNEFIIKEVKKTDEEKQNSGDDLTTSDSGLGADISESMSQNDKIKSSIKAKDNLISKNETKTTKKISGPRMITRSTSKIIPKERNSSIDFLSLIKQKVSEKEEEEANEDNCDNESGDKKDVKKLNLSKLKKKKVKA